MLVLFCISEVCKLGSESENHGHIAPDGVMVLAVHQLLFTYIHRLPPQLFPEPLLHSALNIEQSASCAAASGMLSLSQDSVMRVAQ